MNDFYYLQTLENFKLLKKGRTKTEWEYKNQTNLSQSFYNSVNPQSLASVFTDDEATTVFVSDGWK